MILADTSGLLAFFNSREPMHAAVTAAMNKLDGPIVLSPFVIAELDYLVATRLGVEAELAVLAELASGAYHNASVTDEELQRCAEVIARYRDQDIGVTDASLVVLAQRFGTRSVLTLDRRHFSVLRPLDGGRFKLVPG
jgi:uncharacterized protein